MEKHELGIWRAGERMLSNAGDTEGKAKVRVGLERAKAGQNGKG